MHCWTSTWDLPSSACTAGSQRPDRMPEDMPDRMPDGMPGRPPFASSEGVRRRRGSNATAQFLLSAFSKMATFLQQVCKLFSKIGSYCPQLQIVGQKQRSQPALHSIIQVAIPTVLMDLGGRLRATCCKQATMPSTSRAATIRLKRRGPPQARLKSDSIVFAVHRTGIFPKWPPPCSKSPNFSPR